MDLHVFISYTRLQRKSFENQNYLIIKIYKDHKINHVIGVEKENALNKFLNGTYKNVNNEPKNVYQSGLKINITPIIVSPLRGLNASVQ